MALLTVYSVIIPFYVELFLSPSHGFSLTSDPKLSTSPNTVKFRVVHTCSVSCIYTSTFIVSDSVADLEGVQEVHSNPLLT